MREIFLTAHADWFQARDGVPFDPKFEAREAAFQRLAVGWLVKTFGEDCVHARADRDEKTFHIHAVILPRAVTQDGRRLLQPLKHDAIRNYETAQDDVGAWFAAAGRGLTRGERRKKKVREAIRHNEKLRKAQGKGHRLDDVETRLREYRQHGSPRKWGEEQERDLAERVADAEGREERIVESEAAVAE